MKLNCTTCMVIAEIIMKDARNTKFSYFSDLSWFDGRGTPIPFKNYDGDNFNEVWTSHLPTRSDISGIYDCKNIITLFGDSFMFGHGVPKNKTISHFINKNSSDTISISFGIPGSGNEHTIKKLNQWVNTEHSEKTSAVVFNLAPLPRFDFIMSKRYPDYFTPNASTLWPDLYDETYDNRCIIQNMTAGNPPDVSDIKEKNIRKKIKEEYDSYYAFGDTPIKQLIGFERYIMQMYWMCRALDIPFYYIMNDWLLFNFLNKPDMEWINEKLNKLEKTSKLKRIDISGLHKEFDESEIYLKCGHWTPKINKHIAGLIYKEYLNDT